MRQKILPATLGSKKSHSKRILVQTDFTSEAIASLSLSYNHDKDVALAHEINHDLIGEATSSKPHKVCYVRLLGIEV